MLKRVASFGLMAGGLLLLATSAELGNRALWRSVAFVVAGEAGLIGGLCLLLLSGRKDDREDANKEDKT